jgi:hypothetical protein
MGQKKARKAQFLAEHPSCFACGAPSVEWDHLPSRACFDDKVWPEGFVFPVCFDCNHATSNDEQVIAALARADSDPSAPVKLGELDKYLSGASNNDPELFKTLLTRVVEELPDGKELIEMGPGVREVFRRVLPKWARAFHYLEMREILPLEQPIYGGHFTVPDLARGRGPSELLGLCKPRSVVRGNKDLGSQFGYAHAASPDGNLFAYIVVFRHSIGAWMMFAKGPKHRDDPAAEFSLLPPVSYLKN